MVPMAAPASAAVGSLPPPSAPSSLPYGSSPHAAALGISPGASALESTLPSMPSPLREHKAPAPPPVAPPRPGGTLRNLGAVEPSALPRSEPPPPPPAATALSSPPLSSAAPSTAKAPVLASAQANVAETFPSAPSPISAAALAAKAAPEITTTSEDLPAEEVDALEEIEPERESAPPSDQHGPRSVSARGAAEPTSGASSSAIAAEAVAEPLHALDALDPNADDDDEGLTGDELPIGTEEIIAVVLDPAPEPKRPPPPPKRPGSPDSLRAEAPPSAPPVISTPPSAPAAAQAPPQTPPPAPPAAPASKPAPPTSKAESKKRPWWDDIFSEDFLRTMDPPKPAYIQREVNFIEESLGVEKGAVVLDLACGTGEHAVELASRGYSVVGFDLSLAMLARASDEAQERGQKLNFLQGDMREMAFEEMFDGIYCWSTSFGYFDEEKNLEVLARAHRALRHGGMLLIDIINRDFIAPRQPSLVWFEGDGCVCMDEMHVDFFTSRLKVKRTVMFEDGRTREVDYSIRLYNLHELGKMMHDCGFRVVQVTGQPAHPGVFFGSESPRIIILAERAD